MHSNSHDDGGSVADAADDATEGATRVVQRRSREPVRRQNPLHGAPPAAHQ